MSGLAYRRVAGGREPVRDVVWARDGEPASAWRSRGAIVGRFAVPAEAAARVRDAIVAARAAAPPVGPSTLPSDRLAEYVTLDDASMAVDAGAQVPGTWGELLAACRAALDEPGEPIAAVTLVPEPPARVRLEHRGSAPLELGFGALSVAIRWAQDGAETGYASARRNGGVVAAAPGWTETLELEPPLIATPAGEGIATASFSIRDEGVWIPVSLEVRLPG